MGGYIGARAGTLSTTVANVQDVTATDTTPEVTIINNTHEDSDGGREGKVIFKGQQSGGEETTLAEIQGSHDGTADDEKGDLIFKTNDGSDGANPTEAMRITSAQKIGIGTNDPLGQLTIAKESGGNAPTSVAAANSYLQLGSDDFGPSSNGKFMIGFGYTDATNTNSPAYIGFEETSNSGDTKGDLTFYTRDAVTDTAPTERMRILAAGGLTFNGDTAAANALNDYEEGTWTPSFPNGGTIGTVNSATYTKIGRLVWAGCYISTLSGIPNNSLNFRVGGLPFTVSGSATYQAAGGVSYVNGADWRGTGAKSTPLANINTTYYYFHREDGSTSPLLNSGALV